ncbi:hypothetical protein ACIRG4_30615 [Streptomyces sp. NPDC102395]|uniref:hypothetical protein n=1 Tax=Streptomyces sp. NPDC102395 TaxID=3366168 RepID=UPI00382FC10E
MGGIADRMETEGSRIACRYVYSATPREVLADGARSPSATNAEVTEVQVQM